jgi:hypothetical protein
MSDASSYGLFNVMSVFLRVVIESIFEVPAPCWMMVVMVAGRRNSHLHTGAE